MVTNYWAWLDVGTHDSWCWFQSDDGGDGSFSGCDCGNAPDWWDKP